MVIAHIFPTAREAHYALKYDIHHNNLDIIKVRCNHFITSGGDEHWYISNWEYPRWSKGRTYILDGVVYRSGFELQRARGETLRRMKGENHG